MNNKFPYKSILIACSVNTARSRMVEGYLKHFFAKNNQDTEVCSCGIASNARDGMLISMDAKFAMKEVGIELSDEALSKDLKKHSYLLNNVDLILTLTEQHKKDILKLKEANNKEIYTLKEFAGESGDIDDPSMKGIQGFRNTRNEIEKCLKKGLQKYFC